MHRRSIFFFFFVLAACGEPAAPPPASPFVIRPLAAQSPPAPPGIVALATGIDWRKAPQGPVVADGNVYFARGCKGGAAEIASVPAAGGPIRIVVPERDGGCGGIAVRNGHVFWSAQVNRDAQGRPVVGSSTTSVERAPLAGGSVTRIFEMQGCCESAIVADASGLIVLDPKEGLTLLGDDGRGVRRLPGKVVSNAQRVVASDGHDVYFGEWSKIMRVTRIGNAPPVVPVVTEETAQMELAAIAVDDGNVYYALREAYRDRSPGRDALRVVGKSLGSTPTVIVQASVADVAADAGGVYWVEPGSAATADGRVMMRRPNGAIEIVASGRPSPCGVAVDAASVYWIECGTRVTPDDKYDTRQPGSVMRAAKP
jgi:hypothetical protein